MSSKLLSYSGITTKIKAMESNLITAREYTLIANLQSVPDLINFLKKHPGYSHMFANLDEYSLHRGQIERIIMNAEYHEYAKIYRFASPNQRKILDFIFFRFEVNVLKGCLLRAFNQDEIYNLAGFKEFFLEHSSLNLDKLIASSSIDELISNLKGTQYYSLFCTLQSSNHRTLFDYEMQLDIYYYTTIWKRKSKLLKGRDLKYVTDCIGKQVDLLNIQWIYRSKKFYNIDASSILSVIIPIRYKLSKTQLQKLIESSSLDELLLELENSYYSTLITSYNRPSMELFYREIMLKTYRDNSRRYPFSILPVLNFLFQKEQEIDRITTALECIRYQLEPKQILEYIL